MSAGVYLYCIGWAAELTKDAARNIQVTPPDGSDAEFRVIQHDDLAALVSDTDLLQYDLQRDSLMSHHNILTQVMSFADVLPVSYGMVATSDEDVIARLLAGAEDQVRANLEHVKGRVELSLRVMWNEGQLFQEIVEEIPEIRQLRDSIAGVPEDASYYERIQLGELTSQAISSKNEAEREAMLSYLVPLSVDVNVSDTRSDMLILNASFLVDREREPEFDQMVQEVGGPRQDRMTFRYLGPLPPASFVSIAVGAG